MLYQDPSLLMVEVLKWEDLPLNDKFALLRVGYRPPVGTILRDNLDLLYEDTKQLGDR